MILKHWKDNYRDVYNTKKRSDERHILAKELMQMDRVMRDINDEENGIFESWLMYGVPDGETQESLEANWTVEQLEQMYHDCCELFATNIATLIDKGAWSKEGHTLELWRNPDTENK